MKSAAEYPEMVEATGKIFLRRESIYRKGRSLTTVPGVGSICDKAGEEWEFEVMTIRN